ncbi:MAG: hypothetical protein C0480_03310 [Bradyrhizobium sp.]|nr:hypothetical protein [Bradyrhizobium sp.]
MTVVGPYAAKIGYSGAFAYIAMLSFVPWWIAGLATHVVSHGWGHRFPLWLVAALGALAAGPLILIYASGVYLIAAAWWPSLPSDGRFIMDIERWQAFALSQGRSIVLWVAFVMIFTETFGWKRYAAFDRRTSGPPASDLPAPGLLAPVAESPFQLSGAAWTAEDDRQLHALVTDGLPPRAIASRMQRTFHAVRARTTKLGLKNNKP